MTKEQLIEEVRKEAEGYFERGEFFCSESVVQTINNLLGKPYDENIVKMASGFPIGMGKSGCLCGAVSGGQMALGMIYGRVHGESMNDKMFPAASSLHDYIKDEYGSTCCRVITKQWAGDNFQSPGRKKHCIKITGEVAAWIADKLISEGKVVVE
ncbi:C-GCAxxG-C-C family protein [Schnuerera sp. xch1]|uniref:C-GCAxxG-C-C family protein n=1 Tax=Schnuerera sp. xch1 TaxID=2874283 RepID=UPI001CC0CE6D|nr:C-GCAxxG-C-C family protein [Schnuerera sp. xch1]MBZ2174046.1 C-GCAxxG-C-C family protein [Schnuerera sp. xch1]